ncbi:MAG: S8 family serine peptidase [Saprospiraceae bacterium]
MTYFYQFNGKKYPLSISDDRVVVRTKNARSLQDAVFSEPGNFVLNMFDVEMHLPESDISILKARRDIPDTRTMRDEARMVLKQEPDLRFAGRVLVDKKAGAPVLYTENIFIQFRDKVRVDTCERILYKNGLKIKKHLNYAKNAWFVEASEGTGLAIFDLCQKLLKSPQVKLCHPELIRERSFKNIHPDQWHLMPAKIGNKKIDQHINAVEAHKFATGKGITIAVIDDGFDIDHPEFKLSGKVVSGRDVSQNSNDPRPKFGNENHGTACAGIACAAGLKLSGVAPDASLMPIRMSSVIGSMAEADAFYWAADKGADVISCSWGPVDGPWYNPEDAGHKQMVPLPDSTRLAIEYALEKGRNGKGCVICWAAGNGNEDVRTDGYANFEKVIAVSACNDSGKRSVYSDFGKNITCAFPSGDFEYLPFKHPKPNTKGIYTTDRLDYLGSSGKDFTDSFTGTSASAPGVAGIMALILQSAPKLSWQEAKQILIDSCQLIDIEGGNYSSKGHSKYYGFGRPDAAVAVQMALDFQEDSGIRIIVSKALVDPKGKDKGRERVVLENKGTKTVKLKGWAVQDGKKRKEILRTKTIQPGRRTGFILKKVQLPNNGGVIRILDEEGIVRFKTRYKKSDITPKNGWVYF